MPSAGADGGDVVPQHDGREAGGERSAPGRGCGAADGRRAPEGRLVPCGDQMAAGKRPLSTAPKETVPDANARVAPPSRAATPVLLLIIIGGPPFSTSDAESDASAVRLSASSEFADSIRAWRVAASDHPRLVSRDPGLRSGSVVG